MYENPYLYDLAFSFRNIAEECDGILAIARLHGLRNPRRVAELACGPAHHLRELARRGIATVGIDVEPEMVDYAQGLCERDHVAVRLQRCDMRSFRLRTKVDLALCLFDSFSHCTSDEDGIASLRATAAALRPRGLLILELAHPANFLTVDDKRTIGRWTLRNPDVVVRARFESGRRDAVAETYLATMTIEAKYKNGRKPQRVESRQQHRMWLRSSINFIAVRSGEFDVVGWYGNIVDHVPLTMQAEAWRMVAVLRKRS